MTKLSDKKYWDSHYDQKSSSSESNSNEISHPKKSIDDKLRNTLFRGYADYLLWEKIFPKYLNKKKLKVVEIGSAPGKELVRLHEVFDLEPYGIEYSESGVKLNQRNFVENGINPENVIHADFLSEEIAKKYESSFDIVMSRGFIEHFDNPEEIVKKHINLLKKGGILIISIPNLRGFNYIMQRFFDNHVIQIHNLNIMDKAEFEKLFDDERLSVSFCNYYGTLNFNLFAAKKKTIGYFLLLFFKILQLPFNALFRIVFGKHGAESKIFSPYLIYIGVRT